MRYSKADRENAAILCSARAALWANDAAGLDVDEMLGTLGLRREGKAWKLALAADVAVVESAQYIRIPTIAEEWAEAECLVRTGWTP